MPNWIKEKFDQGQVDAVDRTDLLPGELQTSTNAYYKRGDKQRIWKQNGRSAFDQTTGGAAKVKGLYLAGFDSADDLLIAVAGQAWEYATAGATGTFATLDSLTTQSASATKLSGAHYNDRHFLGNGYDKNRVLESDGTTYTMGMEAPSPAPVCTPANVAGVVIRPAEPSGDIVDPANTMDGTLTTYGYLTATAAGSVTDTFSGSGWTGATGTERQLVIKWALSGMPLYDMQEPWDTIYDDTGGSTDTGFNVTVKMELSTDGGTVYTEIMNRTATTTVNSGDIQYVVGTAVDPDNVFVKITLTYNSGTRPATLRVYDVRMQTGSSTTAFSTVTGLYYGISEYDEDTGAMSPVVGSTLVAMSTHSQVSVALPTAVNARTTHWMIWRTADGGTAPNQLGLLTPNGIAVSQTAFIDDFQTHDLDTQPRPVAPLLVLEVEAGSIPQPRDTAPPSFRRIRSFKGYLVGLRRDAKRALHYSIPGLPESWPEFYVIDKFPMEEHDELMDVLELGDTLLIGAKGVMMRTDDLPRVVNGQFDAAQVFKIQGAPGLVSEYGLTGLSVAGESNAAWISPYGIYLTNGANHACISDDISTTWATLQDFDKSSWVLHWDKRRQCLIFAYSATSGGTNNRYYLFHMAQEHQKANKKPLITGPHYGEYNHLASGQVSSAYRLYSAHVDDGYVYLEDDSTVYTDASNSYDGSGTWPWVVKGRRLRDIDSEFAALKAKLRHSDWGSGQTVSVAYATGRDSSGNSQTRTQTVALSSQKGTLFDIGRGGEWHEVTLTHTGEAAGAVQDIEIEARSLGGVGEVSVG